MSARGAGAGEGGREGEGEDGGKARSSLTRVFTYLDTTVTRPEGRHPFCCVIHILFFF